RPATPDPGKRRRGAVARRGRYVPCGRYTPRWKGTIPPNLQFPFRHQPPKSVSAYASVVSSVLALGFKAWMLRSSIPEAASKGKLYRGWEVQGGLAKISSDRHLQNPPFWR